MCILYPFDETNSWPTLDTGIFAVRAPRETSLRKDSQARGAFVDRRFTLLYSVGLEVDRGAFSRSGRTHKEVQVSFGGRLGVLYTAEFDERAEPYFLELYIPQALPLADGRWYAMEIHGWFMTEERRGLAVKMLRTIDFAPYRPLEPRRPHVQPPTFDIAGPPD